MKVLLTIPSLGREFGGPIAKVRRLVASFGIAALKAAAKLRRDLDRTSVAQQQIDIYREVMA